jgi:hypothetical protein
VGEGWRKREEGERERRRDSEKHPGGPSEGPKEGRGRESQAQSLGARKAASLFRLSSIILHMYYAQVKQPLLDSQLRMFSVL